MKGFNTSTDYSKLWDLIHNDFRIPAWILQSEILSKPIFDLVEVKMLKYRDYPIIGTRGISYSTMENTKEAFIDNCKSLKMLFIIPKKEPNQETLEHTSKFIVFTIPNCEEWVQHSIPLDSFEKADDFCQQFRDKKMSYLICKTLKQGYNGK